MRELPPYALLALFASSATAFACSFDLPPSGWSAPPVEYGTACSFSAQIDPYRSVSGGEVTVLGETTVAQRVDHSLYGRAESIVFSDCGAGEVVELHGLPPWAPGEVISNCDEDTTEISLVLRPEGKLAVTRSTTVIALRKLANRYDYPYSDGLGYHLRDASMRTVYDPFCGCALHFPDSIGAEMSTRSERG